MQKRVVLGSSVLQFQPLRAASILHRMGSVRYVSATRNLSPTTVRVRTAIDLLEDIEEPVGMPADEVTKYFFKRKGFFSPQERKESSKLAFDVIHNWNAVGWWLARIRPDVPELTKRYGLSPRLRVLAYLILHEKWDADKIKQHLEKPTEMEMQIQENLQGKSLADSTMPPWLQL